MGLGTRLQAIVIVIYMCGSPGRNRTLFHCVFLNASPHSKRCTSVRDSYALCRLIRYSRIIAAGMSPALAPPWTEVLMFGTATCMYIDVYASVLIYIITIATESLPLISELLVWVMKLGVSSPLAADLWACVDPDQRRGSRKCESSSPETRN